MLGLDSDFLPKASAAKVEDNYYEILYFFLIEAGWTYEQFLDTPIPVVLGLLRVHKKRKKAEAAAHKKANKKR